MFTTGNVSKRVSDLALELGPLINAFDTGLIRALLRYFVYGELTAEQKAQLYEYPPHMMAKLWESIVRTGSVEATTQIAHFKAVISKIDNPTAQKLVAYIETPECAEIVKRAGEVADHVIWSRKKHLVGHPSQS
jgi:hypothetical protein